MLADLQPVAPGRAAVAVDAVSGDAAALQAITAIRGGSAHPDELWRAWCGIQADPDAARAFVRRCAKAIEAGAERVLAGAGGRM